MANKRVLVGMSGGVDSSVTAALLKQQGYEVAGVTLRLWKDDDAEERDGGCCSLSDIEDARRVAAALDIPHYVLNMKELFYDRVVQDFIGNYESGRTPNPCIRCNRYIKFDEMLKKALETDFSYIATGHYGLVEHNDATGRYELKKSPFDAKDQSYVLYNLTQFQLSHLLLPLGHYTKEQIRAMAEEFNLPVAHKKDSQDICFIENGDYSGFIRRRTGKAYPNGWFCNQKGERIGTHRGIVNYTVGQRKGLGAFGKPMFVLRIHPQDNTIILGQKGDEFQSSLICEDLNWISIEQLSSPLRCEGKIRYKAPRAACTVTPLADGTVQVTFDEPQRAVTPGQAVVFYLGDTVVGGGTITEE